MTITRRVALFAVLADAFRRLAKGAAPAAPAPDLAPVRFIPAKAKRVRTRIRIPQDVNYRYLMALKDANPALSGLYSYGGRDEIWMETTSDVGNVEAFLLALPSGPEQLPFFRQLVELNEHVISFRGIRCFNWYDKDGLLTNQIGMAFRAEEA
ncbi:MAG: hypothetical protein QM757_26470 [Paludibaculum sp.]